MKFDLSEVTRVISRFLHRFHVTLFVVLVVGGLSVATLLLNKAITAQASNPNGPTEEAFDENTMTRIKNLRTTDEQTNLVLPDTGRTDPFK